VTLLGRSQEQLPIVTRPRGPARAGWVAVLTPFVGGLGDRGSVYDGAGRLAVGDCGEDPLVEFGQQQRGGVEQQPSDGVAGEAGHLPGQAGGQRLARAATSIPVRPPPPTLLTRMSIRSQAQDGQLARAGWLGQVYLDGLYRPVWVSSSSSGEDLSAPVTTCTPLPARPRTTARPMALVPPVTTARLPGQDD
jgi:hypothetical protein